MANTTTALLSSADPGLQTTVSGVTVTVTAGSTTLQCPLYYLSPTQVDAVLPGTTPVGNATITVTNNGGTSAAFPIVVVQSAFGILSYNGSLAAAYDANNAILTASNAANPNQVIVLWGSGVGYDPADDDRLYPQKQDNLTNIPMQAYVGGVQATIAYRGRSQFPGVDQVVLTIPGSAPTGCYVSLSIVSGNIVSNSVTIPIAASGRTCSDSNSGLTPDIFQSLSGKTHDQARDPDRHSVRPTSPAQPRAPTMASSDLFKALPGLQVHRASNQVSIGSCLVSTNVDSSSPSSVTITGLDAGASISVAGSGGSLTMSQLSVPGVSLAGFYLSVRYRSGHVHSFQRRSIYVRQRRRRQGRAAFQRHLDAARGFHMVQRLASCVGQPRAGSERDMDGRRGRVVRRHHRKFDVQRSMARRCR